VFISDSYEVDNRFPPNLI